MTCNRRTRWKPRYAARCSSAASTTATVPVRTSKPGRCRSAKLRGHLLEGSLTGALLAISLTARITRKERRCARTGSGATTAAGSISNEAVLTAATSVMAIHTAACQANSKKTGQYQYAIKHVTHSNEISTVRSKRAFRKLNRLI